MINLNWTKLKIRKRLGFGAASDIKEHVVKSLCIYCVELKLNRMNGMPDGQACSAGWGGCEGGTDDCSDKCISYMHLGAKPYKLFIGDNCELVSPLINYWICANRSSRCVCVCVLSKHGLCDHHLVHTILSSDAEHWAILGLSSSSFYVYVNRAEYWIRCWRQANHAIRQKHFWWHWNMIKWFNFR